MKKFLIVMIFWIFPSFAFGGVSVAFIEFLGPDGKPIQFEQGGRFGHVAISYRGGWLQAHPYGGVRVVSDSELRRTGRLGAILDLPEEARLIDAEVEHFLGRAYDPHFNWSDDKIYCSELVGKLLRLAPEKMDLSTDYWRTYPYEVTDTIGLSPDDIYRLLLRRGIARPRNP